MGGYLNEKHKVLVKGRDDKIMKRAMVRSLFCASSLFDGCDDVDRRTSFISQMCEKASINDGELVVAAESLALIGNSE